jgi:repressor LexA
MTKLTKRQQDIYNYIEAYQTRNGYSPSLMDICGGVGLSSPSSASYQLRNLMRLGYINIPPKSYRAIELIEVKDE